jgi:hypothetical protein
MKTEEDEAFEDIERRQGGFQAKRKAAADKLQEPVAWITPDGEGFRIRFSPPTNEVPLGWDALYTTPPQRPWVGLTDEEIADCLDMSIQKTCRAIEAKLKEKNNGA